MVKNLKQKHNRSAYSIVKGEQKWKGEKQYRTHAFLMMIITRSQHIELFSFISMNRLSASMKTRHTMLSNQ
jgi:hypothetical protein